MSLTVLCTPGNRSSEPMILPNHHGGSLRYYDWDSEISNVLKHTKVLPHSFTTATQSFKAPRNVLNPIYFSPITRTTLIQAPVSLPDCCPSIWMVSCQLPPRPHVPWSLVCTVVAPLSQTVPGHIIMQIRTPPSGSPELLRFGPAWFCSLIFYHFALHPPSFSLPTFLAIIQVMINSGPLPNWFSVAGRHHHPSSLCTTDSFNLQALT